MSEASFSGSGFRKQTQVLLTVGDISEAELSQLPLINCPFCPDRPQLMKHVSGKPHSRGAHFVACPKCDKRLKKPEKYYFFNLLMDDMYGRNILLRKIQALQMEKEKGALQATMVHAHEGSSSFAVAEGSSDQDDGNRFHMVCPICHLSVVRLQSYTTTNPGRWFYKCPNHDKTFSRCPRGYLFWEDEYEEYLKRKGNAGTWSATPPASQPPGSLVRGSGSLMQPSPPGERSSPGKAFEPSPVQGSWSPTQPSPSVGYIRRGRSFQPQSLLEEGSSSATFQPCPSRSTLPTTSPVRYQEHPLDYKPIFRCHCNPSQQAGLFISLDECPGRRYYRCMRSDSEGCSNFLGWADPVLPEHIPKLLGYYQDLVDELTLEVDACIKQQKDLGGSLETLMKQLDFNEG